MYKRLIIGLAAGLLATNTTSVSADPHDKGGKGDHNSRETSHGARGYDRDGGDRNANERSNYDRNRSNGYANDRYYVQQHDNGKHKGQYKQAQRGWQSYHQYDYGHPAPGQKRYYANQYYRSGSYYQPRQLSYGDRIYRGQDNRYYCRRSDGTTGLIIGGITGGTLGTAIAPGGSQTLGALIGGSLGALLGSSIDRNNVTCR